MRWTFVRAAGAALVVGCAVPNVRAQRATPNIEETTVADVHAAMRAHHLTCRALVQFYLSRIDAYDKRGPAINSIVVVNPAALATDDSLDKRFAREGPVGPLHCIPMIVKDNY